MKCPCGNELEEYEEDICDYCEIYEMYALEYEALPDEHKHDWRKSYLSASTYCTKCFLNLTYGTAGPEDYMFRCPATY